MTSRIAYLCQFSLESARWVRIPATSPQPGLVFHIPARRCFFSGLDHSFVLSAGSPHRQQHSFWIVYMIASRLLLSHCAVRE